MLSLNRWLLLGMTAAAALQVPSLSFAQGGTVEGQVVFDGTPPQLAPKVKKGDPTAKDAQVCAADDVPDESLVVDPATKGIANVVVYLRKAPANIPADLKKSKEKEVVLDQKGCRYFPHVIALRTDQSLKCISSDAVAHNVHIKPLANDAKNFVVSPNDQQGTLVSLTKAETLPVNVNCDIHPFMQAYCVITDHPYVAVTDKEGKFKIEGLPPGEHSFTVWQEKSGYIERALKVTVKAGTQTIPTIKAPAAKFDKK